MTKQKEKIGFIGIGNMGLPMARNLLTAGHAVTAFDLAQDALDADPLSFYLVRAVNSCGWEGP